MSASLRRLRPRRVLAAPKRSRDVWALQDVTFDVGAGEVVGIIGRNGAGKTTLIKVLSRVTEPTAGRASVRGRIGSLLEVGTGFHPELTGAENVYLSGAILGMSRAEIRRQFDNIVEFSEVGEFLDTPVKRYSSGMYVRLAFAVAAHLETEVLMVDEVLAVGDAAFQRKCLGKMDEVAHQGRTVLFVSHNMAAIENLCASGILLERGRVVGAGAVEAMVTQYLELNRDSGTVTLSDRTDRQGDGRLLFLDLDAQLTCGRPGHIAFHYRAVSRLTNVQVSVGLFSLRGEGVAYLGSEMTRSDFGVLPSEGTLSCDMNPVSLLPGVYTLNVFCTVNGLIADWIQEAARVEVVEGDFFGTGRLPPPGYGWVAIPHQWRVSEG